MTTKLHILATMALMGLTAAIPTGCGSRPQTGFDSPAPSKRLDAIVEASTASDPESLHGLIEALNSSEPAARMLAIRSLERRTGKTFGYDHAAHEWQRRAAVNRWVEFAEYQSDSQPAKSTTTPTSTAPTSTTTQAGTPSP